MINLHGYKIIDEIYSGRKNVIYRAFDGNNSRPVIIKTLKNENPDPEEIRSLEYEYNVMKALEGVKGVVNVFDLIQYENTLIITEEDFGGESLDRILARGKFSLKEFLELSVNIVEALGEIHKMNIIHKDIKPHNLLYNKNTEEVKVIDFGISTRLTREINEIISSDLLEGTLAYISPEQTGRMNRPIDYRTDYYSLGVTFYQLLAGRTPFESGDPMELVYSHIAKMPAAPSYLDPEIPQAVSAIIMKLLGKNAEDRYQSSYGLRADLLNCLMELNENGKVTDFQIAKYDIPERLSIPEKLYGRENEITRLLQLFGKAGSGRSILFVKGEPGIGKSSLINEIKRPAAEKKGYFIRGKYDRLRKSTPLSAVIEAFTGLIGILLSESEESIGDWKDKILKGVGGSGSVLIQVIPQLKLILGEQPDIPDLAPSEAENRFNYIFQNFIKVLAKEDHPLVLFLDDLQWIDGASLKWLSSVLGDSGLRNFLFIGSYRDTEVSEADPLALFIKSLAEEGIGWDELDIPSLTIEDIGNLLCETFYRDKNDSMELAQVISLKTRGNPFFIGIFIRSLYDRGMIVFKNGWEWSMTDIRAANITDNVADFMTERLSLLPGQTLEVMKTASCIGSFFNLDILSEVCGMTPDKILETLKKTFDEGMLDKLGTGMRFSHDRVKDAAYQMLDEEGKKRCHYEIGKSLLKNAGPGLADENIFGLVHHFNNAIDIITDASERVWLAGQNLKAGIMAKAGAAYDSAGEFLKTGIGLLPAGSWDSHYRLAVSLHIEAGEAEYLVGNHENAGEYFNEVLANAKDIMDKVRVYTVQIPLNTANLQRDKALELGRKALQLLGIRMPEKTNPILLITGLFKAGRLVKKLTKGKGIYSLLDLPVLSDPKKLAICQILMQMAAPAYIGYPAYMPIIIIKLLNFTLENGNSAYSALAYGIYGFMLSSVLGKIDRGYRFGELSLKLEQKIDTKVVDCKVNFVFGTLINHQKNHMRSGLSYLENAYRAGMETGDVMFTAYSIIQDLFLRIFGNENLDEIKKKLVLYRDSIKKLKQRDTILDFSRAEQFVINLSSVMKDNLSISGELFDDDEVMKEFIETKSIAEIAAQSVFKLLIHYLYNDYKGCIAIAGENKKFISSAAGSVEHKDYFLYRALALLGDYQHADKRLRKKYLKIVKSDLKKITIWAAHSPENCLHKQLFIEAELAAISGSNAKAMELYEKASGLARKNGFTYEEGMILEHAALFYRSAGLERVSDYYLALSHRSYERWGGKGKTNDMTTKYPGLESSLERGVNLTASAAESITESPRKKPGSSTGTTLDLGTVIKSSNIMAGEMNLEALLGKALGIMMENAGAMKGFLIIPGEGGRLFVQAQALTDNAPKVMGNVPLENESGLCQAIVRYVSKTGESVILGNAAAEGRWTGDEYVTLNKPKSVLCTAIMNKGKMNAILYLENSLIADAFPERRIELLSTLSAQAAISIENAGLYGKLEDYSRNLEINVEERTKELNRANGELAAKNQAMMDELSIAQKVQSSFLPRNEALTQCRDLKIAGKYIAMESLGGDLYDIIKIDDMKYGFLMADVSGHGVSASLMTAMAKASFNTNTLSGGTTAEICSRVNKEICSFVGEMSEHDLTVFFGILDVDTGKFEFSNAAHHPAILYRRRRGSIERLLAEGGYIGLTLHSMYRSSEVGLEPGDRLVLFTDGIVETMNSENRLYDSKRLLDITLRFSGASCEEYIDRVLEDVDRFSGGSPLQDDRAILCIDYKNR